METRIGRRVEGRESLWTYEVVIEVMELDRKTRGRGRRLTSSHSRKTRHPSETVAHAEDQGLGARGEGQDRGGSRRGEKT